MGQGPREARVTSRHMTDGMADDGTAKGNPQRLRVITRMLPSMSWQSAIPCSPPCLASIVISSGRRSKQKRAQRVKCPMCYRTTWPGRDRTPAVANSNRRRDPRPGARQATYPPASANKQDGSATLRAPLRIAHHPLLRRAGKCSQDIRDARSPSPARGRSGNRCGVERQRARRRGARERAGLNHHASMMPAPCPKGSRPGTLQS